MSPFKRLFLAACLSLAALAPFASLQAKEAADLAADPVAEKRLMEISAELRCLVCQNQTIADSNADLALDLRREIRGMIQQGKSDREILDFMVARYGDFVLYRPPVQSNTALLWFGPLVIFAIGLIVLVRYLRRRSQVIASAPAGLTEAERKQAEALLQSASEPKDSAS